MSITSNDPEEEIRAQVVLANRNFFAKVPEWVLYSDISDGALRCYAHLVRRARYSSGETWITQTQLAEKMKRKPRAVRGYFQELKAIGAIAVVTRRFNSATTWVVATDEPIGKILPGDLGKYLPTQLGKNLPTNESQLTRANEREPSSEVLVLKQTDGTDVSVTTNQVDEAFESFWKSYPRREGKQAAKRKFVASLRKGATPHELMQACDNYVKATHGREQKYIKHAATFLGPDEHWREYLEGTPDAYVQADFTSNDLFPGDSQ